MNKPSEEYNNLLSSLYKRTLFTAQKYDLLRMHKILERLGHPERKFKSIHVAGTNGKGSVSTKIAAALELNGYKVGLYTSPHIATFRERIQLNRKLISEKRATQHLRELLLIDEEATFFEMATALAFLYFAEEKVDFGVIETGLGGRLDATNVLLPMLSIITSIGYDHTEILGDTLDKILAEKRGIIKHAVPVVLGPKVTHFTEVESPLFWVENKEFSNFDEENSATARLALSLLQKRFPISDLSIERGLKLRPPCRLEWVRENLVLDVAHNPDGFFALLKALPKGNKLFLLALSKTKDVRGILLQLKDYKIIFTEAKNGRSFPAPQLYETALSLGFSKEQMVAIPDVREAAKEALAFPLLKVVAGTFFIMGDVKKAAGIPMEQDSIDLNERFDEKGGLWNANN